MVNSKSCSFGCNVPLLDVAEKLVAISFFSSVSMFNVSSSAADGLCSKRKNKPRLNVFEKRIYRLIQDI